MAGNGFAVAELRVDLTEGLHGNALVAVCGVAVVVAVDDKDALAGRGLRFLEIFRQGAVRLRFAAGQIARDQQAGRVRSSKIFKHLRKDRLGLIGHLSLGGGVTVHLGVQQMVGIFIGERAEIRRALEMGIRRNHDLQRIRRGNAKTAGNDAAQQAANHKNGTNDFHAFMHRQYTSFRDTSFCLPLSSL